MSSMLKKTGGLSFKPKVPGRRPGAGAAGPGAGKGTTPSSQPPASSASATTTRAPTAETSSQTSTPAPSAPPPATSVDSPIHGVKVVPKETQKETTKENVSVDKPASQPQLAPTVQPTPEPTIPSSTTTSATPATTSPVPTEEPSPQVSSASTPAPVEQSAQPAAAPETTTRDLPTSNIDQSATTRSLAAPPTAAQSVAAPNLPAPAPSTRARNAVIPSAVPSAAPPSSTPTPATTDVEPRDETANTTTKRKRLPRKRKAATTEGEASAVSFAPKKLRFRLKVPATNEGDAGGAETAGTAGTGNEGGPQAKRSSRRRRRSPTPEDAENQTIDHKTMKVGDLTKDLGIGKKFKHADAIAERARQARAAYRLKRLEQQKRGLGLVADDEDSASRAGTPAEGQEGRSGPDTAKSGQSVGAGAAAATQSVGYEVVDGQIIINQQSLMVDRHAAHRDMSALETVEEDEFTHLTTSSSYMRESRRTGPNHWTEEDTEKFYRYLKMFGTDFESIASMFPHKSRRAVKLKFNREENARPKRIDAAVMVRGEKKVSIDIDEYKSHQLQWQDRDSIMADHAKLVQEHNDDLQRLRADRRAAGLLDEEEDAAAAAAKEGGDANGEAGKDAGSAENSEVAADIEGAGGEEAVPA
ncbi:hypothetical protein F4779DRAFT_562429 [Xylariaceae sp. FL0662B]|nr:hypothetical protein F4779DRAFT_562429 [Xylariaceae sp. FL0662B]